MAEKENPKEFPIPTDRLLLLDLDKTLIDAKYQLTDESVLAEIDKIQDVGWQLGFSSDTPLEPLKVWSERFGLKGPIIAEKGSVLWIPKIGEVVINETEEFFNIIKRSFIEKLINSKIPFLHGDATQFVRNNPTISENVDSRIVLINAYRKCSFSFFVRRLNKEGSLEMDTELTKEVVDIVKGLWRNNELSLIEDFNPEYGIYILAPKEVNKRVGTKKLMDILRLSQVGMIGDSKVDIVGKDIAIHYAVGNATNELREISDYISDKNYASGVKDILTQIRNNS